MTGSPSDIPRSSDVPADHRDELEAVLRSRALSKSPSLLKITSYVGRAYLEGQADNLKEYTIAVEALGRPSDFDPKQDSIVRVEAHRLRKKLKIYYESEGAANKLRLHLDPGQYCPRFENRPVVSSAEFPVAILTPISTELVITSHPAAPPSARLRWWIYAAAVFAAFAAAVLSPESAPTPKSSREIRLLSTATGARFFDAWGQAWEDPKICKGGEISFNPAIRQPGQHPLEFLETRLGTVDCAIPLPAGNFELRLYTQGAGTALLRANGNVIDRSLPADRISVYRALSRAPDGLLHLQIKASNAFGVSALEFSEGDPAQLRPIRMVTRPVAFHDRNGVVWDADRWANGGTVVARSHSVKGVSDPNLFGGERFGNFSYRVPVPPGRYTVRLHFAETFFGSSMPGQGGVGSRRFNVASGTRPLLHDFDIFREAGGPLRAITREFQELQPSDGYLRLTFTSLVNNACINAIEVLPEPEPVGWRTPLIKLGMLAIQQRDYDRDLPRW